MTIAEQLNFIADALKPWAEETKTRIEIALDPLHVIGLISTAPGAARVILMFDGEDKRGEFEESGRVDRKFLLVVSRGRGLTLQPGDALTQGVAGGKPLYDLIEEAREMVRALRFDEAETIPNYLATRRLTLGDNLVDAYQIEFSIGTQLPEQLQ